MIDSNAKLRSIQMPFCSEITTIQSLRHTSDLDAGEMYVFLCKVEAWAMNIGCHLTIPQSCEFQLLRDKQEA
ncbi:DLP12 prophage; DNA base-flipping protein [Escherichia coli]|nr:DLP12 prophage; DNA base-flipping protein [Escherichia coli]